jgi:hypothetical protein
MAADAATRTVATTKPVIRLDLEIMALSAPIAIVSPARNDRRNYVRASSVTSVAQGFSLAPDAQA